jgi:hypothetical protein
LSFEDPAEGSGNYRPDEGSLVAPKPTLL